MYFACELNNKVRAKLSKEFDWMSDEEFFRASFFNYRGQWYTMSEFARVENADLLKKGWQGVLNEHAFSSMLISIKNSCRDVIVGRILC